jgi:Raf kinase inhibitor-like YbhB/YbcL family protein
VETVSRFSNLTITRRSSMLFIAAFVALISACAPATTPPTASAPSALASNFKMTSTAFAEGAVIPKKYSCNGENISPPLTWIGAPANTKSFALIMDDPDAPRGTFTHWVTFDLPATQSEIAEGAKSVGKSGKNGSGQTGYTGPCPPSGTHRYFLTLYALDTATLGLSDGAAREEVEAAMKTHIIAATQLMGTYSK